MSFSPPGAVAGRRRWMSMSFPLSSSRPWGRLRPLQATPCRLGFNGSWPPIYQPAGPSEWSSSSLSWRLGGLAEDSIFILRSLGKAIAQRVGSLDTSTETSVCTKQLFHRTAIALWRGNATQWLHRQPTLPPSTDGFVYLFPFFFTYFLYCIYYILLRV